jgi:hypothetical protein
MTYGYEVFVHFSPAAACYKLLNKNEGVQQLTGVGMKHVAGQL